MKLVTLVYFFCRAAMPYSELSILYTTRESFA